MKLKTLRGSDVDIVDISEKSPSIMHCSATLPCTVPIPPNPLLQSVRRARRLTALSTARLDGGQKTSADVRGIPDLSGDLLLAKK